METEVNNEWQFSVTFAKVKGEINPNIRFHCGKYFKKLQFVFTDVPCFTFY